MDKIISYLDNYLLQNKKLEIDAVQANAILSKVGLLKDSKDRPGKPLRDLLRKGKFPHAFQANGRNWIIPHSSKQSNIKQSSENQKINTKSHSDILRPDNSLLLKVLMKEENFKKANEIDNLVPDKPGIYCVKSLDSCKLPEPFGNHLLERNHNLLYIGIASQSLRKRFLNQELRAKGHGTFFRSIGAMLGFRPEKGSLTNKLNKRNYKFSKSDEKQIIEWINKNLKVNWIVVESDFESIESTLILAHKPLINLAKNPLALKILSDLRKECVEIANS